MGPGKSVMPGDLYVVVPDKQVCGVRGGTQGTWTRPFPNIQWPVMGVNELLCVCPLFYEVRALKCFLGSFLAASLCV